jgi:DNA-directed RNA polymerase subunit M/transcription elongation factor TFIIS
MSKITQEEADKFFLRIRLEPLEPYILSNTPRKCKCQVCGSIVYPRLNDVKKAKSCVKCQGKLSGKKIRLSQKKVDAIAKRMKIKLLDSYVNSHTPTKAKCLVCNQMIYPTIGRLSVGVGCMNCGRQRSAKSRLIPKDIALADFKIAKLENHV